MAVWIEPIGFGRNVYGPFEDEIEASEYMDEHIIRDDLYKIVIRDW